MALAPRLSRQNRSDVPQGLLTPEVKKGSWIELGSIGKGHGLKGAFFLTTPDRREEWDGYKRLALEVADGFVLVNVVKTYQAGGMLALVLAEIDSKNLADDFRGSRLFVHSSDVLKEEDDVLVGELTGLEVRDENERKIGRVSGVVSFGAQNNLKIVLSSHKEEVLYPLIDAYVQKIDLEKGYIQVVYLPEFLEEDSALLEAGDES